MRAPATRPVRTACEATAISPITTFSTGGLRSTWPISRSTQTARYRSHRPCGRGLPILRRQRPRQPGRGLAARPSGACYTSCPVRLRSDSTLADHILCVWRRAIDMANLALDANSSISLSSPLLARVADLAAATLEAARTGFSRTTFGGLPGLTNGREAIIVTHPLWLTDRAGAGPEIAAAWDDAERARGLRVDPAWTFISRSEEHTSELQSLMRISYAVFCLKTKKNYRNNTRPYPDNQDYTH